MIEINLVSLMYNYMTTEVVPNPKVTESLKCYYIALILYLLPKQGIVISLFPELYNYK